MARSATPPTPALTPDRIVRRAVAMADAHGIGAFSMRKLAADLSVTPMALYWHFPNRDALLDAMADAIADTMANSATNSATDVGTAEPAETDWSARLRLALVALLDAFAAHPWLGPLVRYRVAVEPHFLQMMESMLDALRDAGLDPATAVNLLDYSVDCLASVAENPRVGTKPDPDQVAQVRSRLAGISPEQYPRIHEAAAEITGPEDPAAYHQLTVDVLLRGIAAEAESRSAR